MSSKRSFPKSPSPSLLAPPLHRGRPRRTGDRLLAQGPASARCSVRPMSRAESHLRKGLELLAALPETVARHRREIALQNTLGVCLMPTRGFGNRDVAAAFTRAAEICERVDDVRGLFVAHARQRPVPHDLRRHPDGARRRAPRSRAGRAHGRPRVPDPRPTISAGVRSVSAVTSGTAQRHAEEGNRPLRSASADHCLTYIYSGHDPGVCCRAFRVAVAGSPGLSRPSAGVVAATGSRWPKRWRIPSLSPSRCGPLVSFTSLRAGVGCHPRGRRADDQLLRRKGPARRWCRSARSFVVTRWPAGRVR